MASVGKPAKATTDSLLGDIRASLFSQDRRYDEFKARYKNDRVAFVRDCFHWPEGQEPAYYQIDILKELDGGTDRLSWRGPRGCRKTSTTAWIVLHFILVHDRHPHRDWKVGMTASVGRQLSEFLWPEIHKWIARLKWDVIGREPFREGHDLFKEQIVGAKRSHAYSFVSNDPDKIEGCHADDVLLIFDESKAVPEASVDAVMGGITGAGKDMHQKAIVIAISTPGPPAGWFYDIHRGSPRFGKWKAIHITKEMCINADSLSADGLQELADKCGGEHTSRFKQQGLGEFAADDEAGIFPLEHIEKAIERWYERKKRRDYGHLTSVGFDVADSGRDDSILAPVHGTFVDELITLPKYAKVDNDGVSQTMAMVGDVVKFVSGHDLAEPVVVVDANGVGAGVASRLKELSEESKHRFKVQSFIAQKKSDKKIKKKQTARGPEIAIAWGEEIPADCKTAAALEVAYMLDPDSGFDVALPDNPELVLQMTTLQRAPSDSSDKVRLMPSDAHKELLGGASPDEMWAVLMGLTAGRIMKQKRKIRVLGDDD